MSRTLLSSRCNLFKTLSHDAGWWVQWNLTDLYCCITKLPSCGSDDFSSRNERLFLLFCLKYKFPWGEVTSYFSRNSLPRDYNHLVMTILTLPRWKWVLSEKVYLTLWLKSSEGWPSKQICAMSYSEVSCPVQSP